MMLNRLLTTGIAVPVLFSTLPCFAEPPESSKTATALQEQTQELKAITVTARKESEKAKEVPFSLNVMNGEEIEDRRLKSLDELLYQTPGVDVISNMGPGVTTLRMRGIGAIQRVSADDTSVVISVDGLPMSSSNATTNVLDMEQVEVLKGPQGTLFGRNSEAGAINITTRKPTDHFEASLKGEYGEDNLYLLEGVVSGPLFKNLSARLAARLSGMDNVLVNMQNNEPLTKASDQVVRGSLLWQPTAATSVTVTAGYEKLLNKDNQFVLRPYGDPPLADIPPGSEDNKRTVGRYTAEIKHDFGNSILTSTTGFAQTDHTAKRGQYEGRTFYQLVGMRPYGSGTQLIDENVINQELRLSSKPDSPLFWVTGANYYHSHRTYDRRDWTDPLGFYPANPYNADIDRTFDNDAYALFGELTIPFLSKFKFTAGMRYSWEDKKYDASWRAKASNPNTIRTATDHQSLHDNYATGRLALGYAVTEQINSYVVYSRGYKTGGFNDEGTNFSNGLSDPAYKPATIDSFEIGLKSETNDHRLGLNIAGFYNMVKDDHLLSFDNVTFATTTENHDTESKGIELDGFWEAGAGFRFSAGMAYTDARIVSSVIGSSSGVAKNNRMPEVPEWSATVSVSHRLPLPNLFGMKSALLSKLTNRYVGSRAADPQNSFNLDPYNKLDGRVGLQSGSSELYVWCDNMLDEKYDLYGYGMSPMYPGGPGAQIGAPARGRVVGVGLTHYF